MLLRSTPAQGLGQNRSDCRRAGQEVNGGSGALLPIGRAFDEEVPSLCVADGCAYNGDRLKVVRYAQGAVHRLVAAWLKAVLAHTILRLARERARISDLWIVVNHRVAKLKQATQAIVLNQ
jgi:hypothetical protein